MSDANWLAPDDTPRWIGLDVGGANLKAADGHGASFCEPFELWRRPTELGEAISQLLSRIGPHDGVALTMTGELADCYATKAEGVRAIVAATVEAAGDAPLGVASVDDRWLEPDAAAESPTLVAAANWRVAARLVARHYTTGAGLWIDVGSTTVDLIPIKEGAVVSRGADDAGRLAAGELVYTGVRRTPVCALIDELPYRGDHLPIAAEWFATTADVWLLLGDLAPDLSDTATADGRPFTPDASRDRLARCGCLDRTTFTDEDAQLAAQAIAQQQAKRVARGLLSVAPSQPDWVVLSGEGSFLAEQALELVWPNLRPEPLGCDAGQNLPAHACAVLAAVEIE